MSFNGWLHGKTDIHRAACEYGKIPAQSHMQALPELHLVTIAENNQMTMRYALPKYAPQMLFPATRDPNMDTWGLYQYPVI